jgi:hypothetical protein
LLKKHLRKAFLKHQLVSSTAKYQGRRAKPRDRDPEQRDASVKSVRETATLRTVQDGSGNQRLEENDGESFWNAVRLSPLSPGDTLITPLPVR